MKTLLFILIATTSFCQCNLTKEELKARNLTRDTTAYTWIVNDPLTCATQAFGRKRDGEIVIYDFTRTLQLLAQNHKDSLFNKIILDRLLQSQESRLLSNLTSTSETFTWSPANFSYTMMGNKCENVFRFYHNQTGELIEWRAPCKSKNNL